MTEVQVQPASSGIRGQLASASHNVKNAGRFVTSKSVGIISNFKSFVNKGNAFDLAVGLVIGTAFTAVVNAIVKDLFNPVLGAIGTKKLNNYIYVIKPGESLNTTYTTTEEAADDGAYVLSCCIFSSSLFFRFSDALTHDLPNLCPMEWRTIGLTKFTNHVLFTRIFCRST